MRVVSEAVVAAIPDGQRDIYDANSAGSSRKRELKVLLRRQ